MIILKNIQKAYEKQRILEDFSIRIEDGDFLAITGQSGSGKTTLLNIMGLLEPPDAGTISIDGHTKFSANDKLLFHRHKAGFLFQNFALIENITVADNLKIALEYRKCKSSSKAIFQALNLVGLPNIENKKIFQLSGGEQQRVALARILLKDPQYIFADEPTGNLDNENRDIVFNHLKNLNDQGKTVILVTHDNELASQARRHILLK